MVLISIIITFAVLSVDTGPEELRREGARLASLLDLASEDAVFSGRDYRVLLQRQGYAFEEFRDSKWQLSSDEMFKPRGLPDNMHLQFTLENEPVDLPSGHEPDDENSASLLLLSGGDIPSFELIISAEGSGKFIIRELDGRIVSGAPDQVEQGS